MILSIIEQNGQSPWEEYSFAWIVHKMVDTELWKMQKSINLLWQLNKLEYIEVDYMNTIRLLRISAPPESSAQ